MVAPAQYWRDPLNHTNFIEGTGAVRTRKLWNMMMTFELNLYNVLCNIIKCTIVLLFISSS